MHLNNCLTEEPLTFAKKTLSTTFSFLTFSLKISPGLAAMQPFLLRCLSLQALRRGAGRRRKGLVCRKMLHFGKIPKKIGTNLANKPLSGPRRRAPRPERGVWRWLCTAWVHSRKPCKRRIANRNEQKFTEQKRTCAILNDSVGLIQHFSSR